MATSIDQVRRMISERFSGPEPQGPFVWVREMFTDRAILELEDGTLQEVDWQVSSDGEITVGQPREVELEYVAKSEGGPRLTGPIVGKDASRHIAYSAVLVPGEPDSDDEILTAEKIEDVAHQWLEEFRAFDVQHSVNKVDAAPVESYLEPADRTVTIDGEQSTLPAGTWTVGVKVHDDATWDEIASGTRTGLSVMGVPADQRDAALAAAKAGQLQMMMPAFKRVTLADVGGGDPNGDWFAPFIGIVDEPAVPKAKFFALKQRQRPIRNRPPAPSAPQQTPWWQRALGINTVTEQAAKEGRRFSDKTYKRLQDAAEVVSALLAEAEEERTSRATKAPDQEEQMDKEEVQGIVSESVNGAVKTALDEALDEKLKPLNERIDALESTGDAGTDGEDNQGTEGDGGDGDGEAEIPPAVKTKLDELTASVEKLAGKNRATSRQPDDDGQGEPATKALATEYDVHGRRIKK